MMIASNKRTCGAAAMGRPDIHANKTACAVLVMSCDAYADLWQPFFTLFAKYWPNCSFPVYLGAEKRQFPSSVVLTLSSRRAGSDWSGRLIGYLQEMTEDYLLLMLDDFFLRAPVQECAVWECVSFAVQNQAVAVRLIPRPGPTESRRARALIGACAKGSPYRLCTQAAVWDRKRLLGLLRQGESIWDFEHIGNIRASEYESGFYAVRKAVLPYQGLFAHHVVEKGKWLPHEKIIFGRKHVGCDFSCRGTLSIWRTILYHSAQILSFTMSPLPWRWQLRIKEAMKKAIAPLVGKDLVRMRGSVGKSTDRKLS